LNSDEYRIAVNCMTASATYQLSMKTLRLVPTGPFIRFGD
jgi:hypothetical protein